MAMNDRKLFLESIRLNRERVPSYDRYPFDLPVLYDFEKLTFRKPVSFLIGENGSGKSTIVEAIAVLMGMNPEGGTQNFRFESKNTVSSLHEYLTASRIRKPKNRFFLRAESFYNFSTELDRIGQDDARIYDSYGGSLHEVSHGEAFLQLVEHRFGPDGLYILDEPEAALSPSRQMSLLCCINDLVRENCQFIIATHSPILLSYRDGEIFDLDDGFAVKNYRDTEIYHTYRMYLDDPEGMQHRLFD